jgi:ribosomal protein S18 acetylase RimI-like enzyme
MVSRGRLSVVEVNGAIAGLLEVEHASDHVFLTNIELAPRFQGTGIGSSIIQALQDDARGRGTPVRLQVLKVNPAHQLHQRLGFGQTGETETHYQMEWQSPEGA